MTALLLGRLKCEDDVRIQQTQLTLNELRSKICRTDLSFSESRFGGIMHLSMQDVCYCEFNFTGNTGVVAGYWIIHLQRHPKGRHLIIKQEKNQGRRCLIEDFEAEENIATCEPLATLNN